MLIHIFIWVLEKQSSIIFLKPYEYESYLSVYLNTIFYSKSQASLRIKIKNRIFYLQKSAEKPIPVHESTVITPQPVSEAHPQESQVTDPPAKLVKCLESSSDDLDVEGIINKTLNETMANDALNIRNLTIKYKLYFN